VTPIYRRPSQLDQSRRPLEIFGGQCMADRISRRAVLLMPLACPPMQDGRSIGLLLHRMRLENICE
jgi:hypothetical protein